MSRRSLAGAAAGLCVVLAPVTLLLLALGAGEATPADRSPFGGWSGAAFVVASMAFGIVGATVARRVPGNPIGWLLVATGVFLAVGDLASQYAERSAFLAGDPLPGGAVAAWLQDVGVGPPFGLLTLALLLFPDGRLPSRRWRPVAAAAVLGIALMLAGTSVRPGPLTEPFEMIDNPFGVPGARAVLDAASGIGFLLAMLALGAAALGLPFRLRRARGIERQQLKWLALAGALTSVAVVADMGAFIAFNRGTGVPLGLVFTLFPLAAGAAILRHRLYDVDVVINRTLVYGALTVALAGAYLLTVLVLQLALRPLTSDSDLAVAGSTLAVAALFRPARTRIQHAVDRRFFRRRYDASRTLQRFGERLRDEVDLDALSAELVAVVDDAMRPAHVALWVRDPAR